MPKIIYLGAFTDATNTESYIEHALTRLGCEVVKLEESTATEESIVAAAREHNPDLLLFAKARFCGANQGWPEDAYAVVKMLEAVRPHVGKVVCWLFDLMAKEFSPNREDWSRMVAAACDKFVLTDGFTAPRLPNSLVIRQGVPDDVDQDCPWNCEPRWDVLFLGTPYRDRQELVQALARRFGDKFKHVNDCRGKDLTRLIRSCRICVGPQFPYFANYWSNRVFVVCGHGGLFAAPSVPGMDSDGWRSGDNYLALPLEPEAMAAKVHEYLNKYDAGQLETIRRRGYEHANANCSYDVRCKQLLAALRLDAVEEPTELETETNFPNLEVEPVTHLGEAAPAAETAPEGEQASG